MILRVEQSSSDLLTTINYFLHSMPHDLGDSSDSSIDSQPVASSDLPPQEAFAFVTRRPRPFVTSRSTPLASGRIGRDRHARLLRRVAVSAHASALLPSRVLTDSDGSPLSPDGVPLASSASSASSSLQPPHDGVLGVPSATTYRYFARRLAERDVLVNSQHFRRRRALDDDGDETPEPEASMRMRTPIRRQEREGIFDIDLFAPARPRRALTEGLFTRPPPPPPPPAYSPLALSRSHLVHFDQLDASQRQSALQQQQRQFLQSLRRPFVDSHDSNDSVDLNDSTGNVSAILMPDPANAQQLADDAPEKIVR